MKRLLTIGPYVWHGIPGYLMVEITDMTPTELANYRSSSGNPATGPTIRELKQKFGGMQGYLVDAIGGQQFLLDLSPWSHLDENTHLVMTWRHKADPPVPITDPRHPHYRRIQGDIS